MTCADPGGEGGQEPPHTPEKSHKYRVSLQYWSGSPENHKAFKPAFNVGPSSAHGLYWYLDSPSPHQLKKYKKMSKLEPSDKIYGSAHD